MKLSRSTLRKMQVANSAGLKFFGHRDGFPDMNAAAEGQDTKAIARRRKKNRQARQSRKANRR